eukprot:753767-Hanusia_phi.AAC.3
MAASQRSRRASSHPPVCLPLHVAERPGAGGERETEGEAGRGGRGRVTNILLFPQVYASGLALEALRELLDLSLPIRSPAAGRALQFAPKIRDLLQCMQEGQPDLQGNISFLPCLHHGQHSPFPFLRLCRLVLSSLDFFPPFFSLPCLPGPGVNAEKAILQVGKGGARRGEGRARSGMRQKKKWRKDSGKRLEEHRHLCDRGANRCRRLSRASRSRREDWAKVFLRKISSPTLSFSPSSASSPSSPIPLPIFEAPTRCSLLLVLCRTIRPPLSPRQAAPFLLQAAPSLLQAAACLLQAAPSLLSLILLADVQPPQKESLAGSALSVHFLCFSSSLSLRCLFLAVLLFSSPSLVHSSAAGRRPSRLESSKQVVGRKRGEGAEEGRDGRREGRKKGGTEEGRDGGGKGCV